jgi:hypothetical protein
MDISTGLGLLAGAIVVLTMIFMGGDLRCLSAARADGMDGIVSDTNSLD